MVLNINVMVAGLDDMPTASFSMSATVSEQQLQKQVNNANDEGKEQSSDVEAHDLQERYSSLVYLGSVELYFVVELLFKFRFLLHFLILFCIVSVCGFFMKAVWSRSFLIAFLLLLRIQVEIILQPKILMRLS